MKAFCYNIPAFMMLPDNSLYEAGFILDDIDSVIYRLVREEIAILEGLRSSC